MFTKQEIRNEMLYKAVSLLTSTQELKQTALSVDPEYKYHSLQDYICCMCYVSLIQLLGPEPGLGL